jgi:hypothetical protein
MTWDVALAMHSDGGGPGESAPWFEPFLGMDGRPWLSKNTVFG